MPARPAASPPRCAADRDALDARVDHGHDAGLEADLRRLLGRRRLLRGLAGGLALALAGCGGGGDDTAADDGTGTGGTDTGGTDTSGTDSCSVIPEETAGPYPGDGSNTSNGGIANALLLSGIVRSDIRSSIAGATGTAEGVPLVLTLRLVDTSGGCADLSGHAIYLWHCTRDGQYSMYARDLTGENFLRGVQVTGSDGTATFTTIFPGCYDGRVPHMHFEIYRDANTATSFSNRLATSQLTFPRDVCETVYAQADGYSASVSNLSRVSVSTDNVFSDGVDTQTAAVDGSVAAGYTASLTVGIAA